VRRRRTIKERKKGLLLCSSSAKKHILFALMKDDAIYMRFNENYWSLQIVKEMVVVAGFIVMGDYWKLVDLAGGC
jgi:hypothetical protein